MIQIVSDLQAKMLMTQTENYRTTNASRAERYKQGVRNARHSDLGSAAKTLNEDILLEALGAKVLASIFSLVSSALCGSQIEVWRQVSEIGFQPCTCFIGIALS